MDTSTDLSIWNVLNQDKKLNEWLHHGQLNFEIQFISASESFGDVRTSHWWKMTTQNGRTRYKNFEELSCMELVKNSIFKIPVLLTYWFSSCTWIAVNYHVFKDTLSSSLGYTSTKHKKSYCISGESWNHHDRRTVETSQVVSLLCLEVEEFYQRVSKQSCPVEITFNCDTN